MVTTNALRRDFLKSAQASAAKFKKTGIAYAHSDVMRCFLEKAAGRKPPKPRRIRVRPSQRERAEPS
jgi:hypothetical protein